MSLRSRSRSLRATAGGGPATFNPGPGPASTLRIALGIGVATMLILASSAIANERGRDRHGGGQDPVVAAARAGGPCGHRTHTRWRHIIVMVLENTSFRQVEGHFPYLNGLARRCGLATNYWAITHPSLPNYLALTSGRRYPFSTGENCDPAPGCRTSARSIFGQVGHWKVFAEGMRTDCRHRDTGEYTAHHNPAVYYTRVARACRRRDVPLGAPRRGLTHALDRSALPRCVFIEPSDRHTEGAASDAWLKKWVPRITHSPQYRRGRTALFITYDEGSDTSNRVYTVVVGPITRPGTRASRHFGHFALLRTWEQMLDRPCLGNACSTRSMRGAFSL